MAWAMGLRGKTSFCSASNQFLIVARTGTLRCCHRERRIASASMGVMAAPAAAINEMKGNLIFVNEGGMIRGWRVFDQSPMLLEAAPFLCGPKSIRAVYIRLWEPLHPHRRLPRQLIIQAVGGARFTGNPVNALRGR